MKKSIKTALKVKAVADTAVLTTESLLFIKILHEAKQDYKNDLDYLFVLGGHIIGAETPSEHLMKRIEKAAEYLNAHRSTVAITCGGCFRKGQKKSEALIIKEHLIKMGIDEERIILEDKSTTTIENFRFGKEIIESHSEKNLYELSVGFLSSDYHLLRAGIIAKINGLPGLKKVGAKSSVTDFIRGATREVHVFPELITTVFSKK